MASGVEVSGAVEGLLDEAVLKRLLQEVGAAPGPIYGKRGKDDLKRSVSSYNNAARFTPWIVLVDLNDDAACAPALAGALLPSPAPWMVFRVVVRAVEAWLLGDGARAAAFLGVPATAIPPFPEQLEDPKRAMVDLARRSRKAQVRDDMVPRPGSGRAVGPAYTSRLVEFASDRQHGWRPPVAARSCHSLARCLSRMQQVVAKWSGNTP
jgi:hypothetical protein